MKNIIYALLDPRSGNVRYIGKSTNGLLRPREHSQPNQLKRRVNEHSSNWIRQLLALGMKYEIVVLEECTTPDTLSEREIWWIAFARAWGCKLTNLTDGGEGTVGRVRDAAERAKHSATLRTPEELAKSRARAQARWADPVYRAKQLAYMNSPECVERRRATKKAHWAAKHDELAASVKQGCSTPEELERRRGLMQERNADPDFCAARDAGHRTGEARKNLSEAAYERWGNPEFRARRSAEERARPKSPEEKEAQRARMATQNADPAFREAATAGHRTPEARENLSEAAKRRWESPGFREKCLEAMRKSR